MTKNIVLIAINRHFQATDMYLKKSKVNKRYALKVAIMHKYFLCDGGLNLFFKVENLLEILNKVLKITSFYKNNLFDKH